MICLKNQLSKFYTDFRLFKFSEKFFLFINKKMIDHSFWQKKLIFLKMIKIAFSLMRKLNKPLFLSQILPNQ